MSMHVRLEQHTLCVRIIIQPEHNPPLGTGKHRLAKSDQSDPAFTHEGGSITDRVRDERVWRCGVIAIDPHNDLKRGLNALGREGPETLLDGLGASIGRDEHAQVHRTQYTDRKLHKHPESGRYLLT
jgi:hypothetical protein